MDSYNLSWIILETLEHVCLYAKTNTFFQVQNYEPDRALTLSSPLNRLPVHPQ